MKFMILASVLMSAFSNIAFASELCGTLGSHTVGPKCVPGNPCPMWVKLQFDLTTTEGTRYDLETSDNSVFANFSEFRGSNVCVSGSESKDASFDVESISTN